MIIQCDKCSTKFRIDDSKVTPTGVKVRCTKCQNVFIAKQPRNEEPPAPQPKEPETEKTGFTPQEQETDATAGAPQSGGFDFSAETDQTGASQTPAEPEKKDYSIGSEYNMTETDYAAKDATAPFGVETGKSESEQGWKITNEEPEGTASSPAKKTDEKTPLTLAGQTKKSYSENGAEAMSKDLTAGMDDESADASAGFTDDSGSSDELIANAPPAKARAEEPSSKGAIIVGIIIAAVILIGAYAMRVAVSSSAKKPQATLSVENITGSFAENKNIGKVFIIQAKIRNTSDNPQQVRGVMGAVYDASGKKLSGRMVSPGRTVSADEIKNLTKEELLKQFKDAKGAAIPPKATVPAMIVFTETPSGIAEYGVDILR